MTFSVFISKATAFLMALFMTLVPYSGIEMPGLRTKEDDCKLNVEFISDTHLEADGIFRFGFLKQGFANMKRSSSVIDTIVNLGDITNYADEETLAQYFECIKTYAPAPVISVAGNHDIGHAGDRNVTDISREEALANFIRYRNEYLGTDYDVNYYSTEVNGYKFIILGDEVIDGGHWDAVSMTQEQLDFLDAELEEGTKDGLPVFVCCHWPFDGINGEDIIWDESGIQPEDFEYQAKSIMEKYDNVFYLSGHMHGGIRSTEIGEKYNMPLAEQVNGVTYISLPTYGIINWYGITWSGLGGQLEVYSDKVMFRPVNYLTGNWYTNSAYTFELV